MVQSLMEDVSFSCEVSRAFLPASFLTVLLSRTTGVGGVVIQLSICTNLPDVRTFASTVKLVDVGPNVYPLCRKCRESREPIMKKKVMYFNVFIIQLFIVQCFLLSYPFCNDFVGFS